MELDTISVTVHKEKCIAELWNMVTECKVINCNLKDMIGVNNINVDGTYNLSKIATNVINPRSHLINRGYKLFEAYGMTVFDAVADAYDNLHESVASGIANIYEFVDELSVDEFKCCLYVKIVET